MLGERVDRLKWFVATGPLPVRHQLVARQPSRSAPCCSAPEACMRRAPVLLGAASRCWTLRRRPDGLATGRRGDEASKRGCRDPGGPRNRPGHLLNRETRLDSAAPDRRLGQRLRPSVASLLHRAVRAERRRAGAWLLAGAVTAAAALALASAEGALLAGLIGLGLAVWSARQVIAVQLARRDFHSADTPPRRAYVVLLHDPNPRAVRPLLAVWSERPPAGQRLPKPQAVWRCEDELDELESSQGSVARGVAGHGPAVMVEAPVGVRRRRHRRATSAGVAGALVCEHGLALGTARRGTTPHAGRSARGAEDRRRAATRGQPTGSVAGRIVFLAVLTGLALALT